MSVIEEVNNELEICHKKLREFLKKINRSQQDVIVDNFDKYVNFKARFDVLKKSLKSCKDDEDVNLSSCRENIKIYYNELDSMVKWFDEYVKNK